MIQIMKDTFSGVIVYSMMNINNAVLKSLIDIELYLEEFYNKEQYGYHKALCNLLIDIYEDFFIGKYLRSGNDYEKHEITGMVIRPMGLRFTLAGNLNNKERYFFKNDSILDAG